MTAKPSPGLIKNPVLCLTDRHPVSVFRPYPMQNPTPFDSAFRTAALGLSAQADNQTLARTFIKVLHEAFHPQDLKLYDVHRKGNRYAATQDADEDFYLVDTQAHNEDKQFLNSLPGASQCLNNGGLVALQDDAGKGNTVLRRVDGKLGPVALIELRGIDTAHGEIDALNEFAELYQNLYGLLATASQDGLTGLLNRRMLQQSLGKLVAAGPVTDLRRASDLDAYPYLVLADLDHFKRVNDNYGHVFGDEVLLLFTKQLESSFRHGDQLYRYGGEEFAILLEPCSTHNVQQVLERFRVKVANFVFPQIGTVTASIGACRPQFHEPVATTIDHADRALYYAKEHGRNQVQIYEELLKRGEIHLPGAADNDIELF